MKSNPVSRIVLWITLAVCLTSCGKGQEMSGKYEAVSEKRGNIVLELKHDGSGVWMFDDDEAFFKWEARQGNVWIHTKDGGVIVGHMEDKAIRISLPGIGEFVFKPAK